MIKKLLLPTIVLALLFLTGAWVHNYVAGQSELQLPFSIEKAYQFHFIFSLLLVIHFEFLSRIKNLRPQLGFIYLVSVVLKLVLVGYVFKDVLIDQEVIALSTKLALLIPSLLFLFAEVIFISKIILRKTEEY
ncbi:MAG: hypothetical protein CMB99_09035 [Flavobacteriaceae bacterium]|nr:hypothetical protein [Flavobacteriaceae bacterium]|tara:strand:+ start:531767 stop:532165 length:399 start_codon:yes stop_codon:yes gene_type:complete